MIAKPVSTPHLAILAQQGPHEGPDPRYAVILENPVFPIVTSEQLPEVGTSSEHSSLDFKRTGDPAAAFEMAKDVAALANTTGGTILVGAITDGQRLVRYDGTEGSLAKRLGESYERAAKDLCRPTPSLQTTLLSVGGRITVLAVNVWMSPLAPVGVRVREANVTNESWAFPRRVGSQTQYLQPDQFGALDAMTARRVAALLLGVPDHERRKIRIRWSTSTRSDAIIRQNDFQGAGHLIEVSLDRNYARFMLGNPSGDDLKPLFVPLDWIHTVWRDDLKNEWQIALDAVVAVEGDRRVAHQRVS